MFYYYYYYLFFLLRKCIIIYLNYGKIAIFTTICWTINFFCNWCFLNQQSFCINTVLFHWKLAKYMMFHDLVLNFRIELQSIPVKIGKLSPLIGNKKLPRTLRNCPMLHENWRLFRKQGVLFHKNNYFRKTDDFSCQESPAFTLLLDGISKFWVWILSFHAEIQALLYKIYISIATVYNIGHSSQKFFRFYKLHIT